MLLGSMHGAREMDAIWLETCNGAVCNGQQAQQSCICTKGMLICSACVPTYHQKLLSNTP